MSRRSMRSSSPPTGWPPRVTRAKMRRSTTPCARWRSRPASRSASPFRWARTRCRCARHGAMRAATMRSRHPCRSSCRPSRRCATRAARPHRCCRAMPASSRSSTSMLRTVASAWGVPRSRRCTASSATTHPISTIRRRWRHSSPSCARCARTATSSRITTSPTAGSWSPCSRWRSLRAAGSTSRCPRNRCCCRRSSPRSWAP